MRPITRFLLLGRIDSSLGTELVVADCASGRLLRLTAPELPQDAPPRWLQIEHLAPELDPDPARPEQYGAKLVTTLPRLPKRRYLVKLLRSLQASESMPPLFLPGPSVAYSRFSGTSPSLAILGLNEPVISPSPSGPVLAFRWSEISHQLPLASSALAGATPLQPVATAKQWKSARGSTPRFALAAFSPPSDGYCKKWVIALY